MPDTKTGSSEAPHAFDNENQWRLIRNRMIGYLDAAGVPPVKALEMSLDVVSRLRRRENPEHEANPVAAAMQMLRRMLGEQNWISSDKHLVKKDEEIISHPTPPQKPGEMTPESLASNTRKGLLNWALKMTKFIKFEKDNL